MAAKRKKNTLSGAGFVSISILVILVLLIILYYLYYRQQGKQVLSPEAPPAETAKNVEEELLLLNRLRNRPEFGRPETRGKLKEIALVEHTSFSLGYSEEHEQAAWVAYILSRQHALNAHERRNNFRTDPLVSSGSAHPEDYSRSGFDRGHLAPAADFDHNRKALSETFYMSNISPQKPAFNRGAWKELEELVRSLATEYDSLRVVTGPVLEGKMKKIGSNRVSVPNYFYKIIFISSPPELKMIGFLMPNRKISKSPVEFVVSVDSIENLSGLDFFPQLPDRLEDFLESNIQEEDWVKK